MTNGLIESAEQRRKNVVSGKCVIQKVNTKPEDGVKNGESTYYGIEFFFSISLSLSRYYCCCHFFRWRFTDGLTIYCHLLRENIWYTPFNTYNAPTHTTKWCGTIPVSVEIYEKQLKIQCKSWMNKSNVLPSHVSSTIQHTHIFSRRLAHLELLAKLIGILDWKSKLYCGIWT